MNQSIKTYKNSLNQLKIGLNQILFYLLILFIVSTFIPSCASIQQPTGGPRDSIPPKILKETPANFTRNFKEKQISILFDEYVKLKNEFTEFSITPDVDIAPEYKIKKKSLLINLPDSLEENTTYSINFGKGLVDFNEGNELVNYRYVFSTGNEIDSLTISGNAINAVSLKPQKDLTILLIPIKQDSIFGKRKANIFTRTDTSGNFKLQNLSENTYRIYALKETNNDRIFNNPGEEIGFLNDSIHLTKDISGIKLKTFKEIPASLRILERKIENTGKMSLLLNKSISNPSIKILNNDNLNTAKITEISKTQDSILMWLPELTFDTLDVELSQNNIPIDTITFKRNKNDKYERDITITDNLSNQRVDQVRNIILTASAPIKSADLSKIKLVEDSTARTNFQLALDDKNNRKAYLKYRWRAKRTYVLELQEGAFIGSFDEKSKEGQRKFTYDDTENYGDIILNLQLPDSNNYIVELLRQNQETPVDSRSINSSQKLSYKQFPGGDYSVRIIYDDNNNKIWDTGNISEKIQPEEIWYWNKLITIRPNWEQEEIIKVPSKDASNKALPAVQPTSIPVEEEAKPSNNAMEEPYIKSGIITPKEPAQK